MKPSRIYDLLAYYFLTACLRNNIFHSRNNVLNICDVINIVPTQRSASRELPGERAVKADIQKAATKFRVKQALVKRWSLYPPTPKSSRVKATVIN